MDMEWSNIFFRKKGVRISVHAFLWFLFIIIIITSENVQVNIPISGRLFSNYVIVFLGFIFISYFNMYFLIPKYFKTKRYAVYSIFIIGSILITSELACTIIKNFSPEFASLHHNGAGHHFHMFFSSASIVIGTSFIYFVGQWIKLQDITIRLREKDAEGSKAELQALKAQINPHFLFNTLNNIYSYSLDKSDKTPDMILKLSELMSYVLHDGRAENVNIQQEIRFIKNYIELEKLRFDQHLELKYHENLNTSSITIAPLLFIPFVENAFKYCSNKRNQAIEIDISFQFLAGTLLFVISNTFEEEDQKTTKKESGIGIENVRKRLKLLYPGKHELLIAQNKNKFTVELKLITDADQMYYS
jgi:two-component system LytT family sensor kinase